MMGDLTPPLSLVNNVPEVVANMDITNTVTFIMSHQLPALQVQTDVTGKIEN